MSSKAIAIVSAIESHAAAAGGTLGAGTFLRLVLDQLKSLAVQQVDTEEERDQIKDAILALADRFVAPKFPWGWALVRRSLDSFLDERLDDLPALLTQ